MSHSWDEICLTRGDIGVSEGLSVTDEIYVSLLATDSFSLVPCWRTSCGRDVVSLHPFLALIVRRALGTIRRGRVRSFCWSSSGAVPQVLPGTTREIKGLNWGTATNSFTFHPRPHPPQTVMADQFFSLQLPGVRTVALCVARPTTSHPPSQLCHGP